MTESTEAATLSLPVTVNNDVTEEPAISPLPVLSAPAPAAPGMPQFRRSTEDWFMMYDWPDEIYWGQGAPMSTYGGLHQFEALIADYQEEYLTTADDQEKEEIARDVLSELATSRTKIWRKVESDEEKAERGIQDGIEAWVQTDEEFLLVEIKKVLRTPNVSTPAPLMETAAEQKARLASLASPNSAMGSATSGGGVAEASNSAPHVPPLPHDSTVATLSTQTEEQKALIAQLGIMGDRERQLQTLLLLQQQELLVMQQRHVLQQQQHILAWQQNQLHLHQETVLQATAVSTNTVTVGRASASTLSPTTPLTSGPDVGRLSHDLGHLSMAPTSQTTAATAKKGANVAPVTNALDHATADLIRLSQAISQELLSRGVVPPK